jgi:hypothetical protein
MNAKFTPPSARRDGTEAQRTPGDATATAVDPAGLAERACCCPARAAVRVTIPPSPARPHETGLLLCGHHYRVSSPALEAAHAAVRELPGTPRDVAAWIDVTRLAAFTER